MATEDFLAKNPGQRVEVIFSDHQNKPDLGSATARRWFDSEGVDVIADLPTSAVALAVLPIATERKKILLATTPTNLRITNDLCNGMVARFASDAHSLNASVPALLKQGGDTWFFVSWDNTAGADSERDATETINAMGGKVVGSVKFPLGTVDMSSFLLQAQASKAKVVAIAAGGGDLVNGIKAAAEFGMLQSQRIVGLNMSLADVHSLGLKVAAGMYYADGFYWDRTPETRDFAKRYFERNGGTKMPDNVAAGNYSATMHYLNAVVAAGTVEAMAVMEQMRKTPVNDFYATNGVLRMDGQMVHDAFLLQAKTPAESKGPWDYLKVVATIPASEAYLPLSASKCPLVKK
jgi:branched-chain amino acid transport system substrate-binding protein